MKNDGKLNLHVYIWQKVNPFTRRCESIPVSLQSESVQRRASRSHPHQTFSVAQKIPLLVTNVSTCNASWPKVINLVYSCCLSTGGVVNSTTEADIRQDNMRLFRRKTCFLYPTAEQQMTEQLRIILLRSADHSWNSYLYLLSWNDITEYLICNGWQANKFNCDSSTQFLQTNQQQSANTGADAAWSQQQH